MIRHPLPSPTRGLVLGLDVLLVVLVVVTVAQAPRATVWPTAVVAVALLAIWAWGRWALRVHERSLDDPRGVWWPDVAWILALTCFWGVLLLLSPAALWIAFPLMLLQMHVLGPHRGPVAVLVTSLAAVADGLLAHATPDDPWTGFVLGPLLGAGVAVGVVLGIEAFVRESQTRQRTLDELTQVRRHLEQAERDRAVTDERARVARDIHDSLAQSLSAVDLLLRAAEDAVGSDDARALSLVGQARGAAQDSLAEARRVVQDLTPVELDRTTLVMAVRQVAERAADVGGGRERRPPLAVSVHTSGTPRALPVPLEIAVLRIVQSALANVVEHADAARAHVTLTYDPGSITLDVVDDGSGFDPAVVGERLPGRGFGLPAVRTRVDELGGTLALETAPGAGTAVAVTIPIPPTTAEGSR